MPATTRARRVRASAQSITTSRKASPVQVLTPHPKAWAHARGLAKGDLTRLRTQPDGSVVVLNPPPE